MKVVILYHPESDHARAVETYARDYDSSHHGEIELISLETKQGADMARLYDVVKYPAVLAIRDNGELLKQWQEEQLPLMQEVASYQIA
jgi:spore cortex formation protein SpoVR/YcgB (stage V sporulation)